jgi:hypothetical protein
VNGAKTRTPNEPSAPRPRAPTPRPTNAVAHCAERKEARNTRDLAVIKNDVKTNLDKRLQLEVRVSSIEKHLGLDKKIAA